MVRKHALLPTFVGAPLIDVGSRVGASILAAIWLTQGPLSIETLPFGRSLDPQLAPTVPRALPRGDSKGVEY